MDGPHLDVLFQDEFSQFVADGLSPDVVVHASENRIAVGLRSADETVDVFLGDISPEAARSLADSLEKAAAISENGGETLTVAPIEAADTESAAEE